MLKKKERERYYFDRFRKAISGLPLVDPSEPEPPDFLLSTPEERLGVELTRFFLPPPRGKRPGQEIQSLRERIVRTAEEIYVRSGGPALYVRVMFSDHTQISKADVRSMAIEIADTILSRRVPRSVDEPGLSLDSSDIPPGIVRIGVSGSIDGTDKLWSVSRVSWVSAILPDHVNTSIARKLKMAKKARSQCDALWLVIVHDIFRGALAELSDEAQSSLYRAPFDKIWWLEPHIPSAIELKIAASP